MKKLLSKRADDEHESQDRWLVSYADFITLLFAFFAVLYATSQQDVEKTKMFQESLRKYLIQTGAFGGSGGEVNQGEKYNSPIETPIPTYQSGVGPEVAETQKVIESFIEEKYSAEEIEKLVKEINATEQGVRVAISVDDIFANNSSRFKPDALGKIDKIAELISATNKKVIIEGHTDGQNPKNLGFASNWELSSAWSTTLVRYLVEVKGIAPENLASMSYAGSRPVVPNKKGEPTERNRRLEIIFLKDNNPF